MKKIFDEEERMYIKWCCLFIIMFLITNKYSLIICNLLNFDYNLTLPITGINIVFALTIILTICSFFIIYKLLNYIAKVIANYIFDTSKI